MKNNSKTKEGMKSFLLLVDEKLVVVGVVAVGRPKHPNR
jgi:hypothetical protein